ncbi:MAG TPA: SAM-dependent methyltransferase [Streptosporangiaceae bacterium]
MANDDAPRGVGQTAIGVARIRARESERADRLFHDPYAEAFVTAAQGAVAKQRTPPDERTPANERTPADGLTPPNGLTSPDGPAPPDERMSLGEIFQERVVIRTRFLDDYLIASAAAGCRQVVLLAVGMDTRGYRLEWPAGTQLFEIDQPDVLAFKDAVLNRQGAVPRCRRTALAADLRENWADALLDSGFRPSVRTAWLAEGLLIYLTAEEAGHLLTATTDLSAPGSRIAFEYNDTSDGSPVSRARTLPGMSRITSLWKGGLGSAAPDWLTRHGWQVQTRGVGPVAASYNRRISGQASGGFLTATRGEVTKGTH